MWSNLIKSNVAYTVGSVANGIAMLLLVPFLVNTLSTAEYGAWAIYEVTIYILIAVFSLGLEVGLMREYLFVDESAQRRLIGTILIASLMWGVVLCGMLLLINSRLPESAIPGGSRNLAIWIPLIAWAESTFIAFLSIFRIQQRAFIFAGLSLLKMFTFLIAAIVLVSGGLALEGALLGRLAGVLLALLLALALTYRSISFKLDRVLLNRCLLYGLPLFPYNLASYILLASDRYILEAFVTLEAVAVYAFAYKVATALDVAILRPFNTDWAARRFQIAKDNNALLQYGRVQYLFPFVVISFSLLLWSGIPLVYHWFAPADYMEGISLVPIILLAFILWGMEGPVNIGIMLKDKTRYMPIVGWLAAIICLVLNFIFIPKYGMFGAAWTTVVAYAVHTVTLYIISQRIYYVPPMLLPIVTVLVVGIIGYGGIELLSFQFAAASIYLLTAIKVTWVVALLGPVAFSFWRYEQRRPTQEVVPTADQGTLKP